MTTEGEAPKSVERLRELRGVTWEWKDDAPQEVWEQPGVGVIAQEVERVFPDLVETDPETGIKRVAYYGLIGPLIEAVKELDARLRTIEDRLDRLEEGGT
jgi:hypothetical protein